jgi:hypothetical protein
VAVPPENASDDSIDLPITAYLLEPLLRMPIIAAPRQRDWIARLPHACVEACAPLVVANQSGWLVLSAHKVAATWDGGTGAESLRLDHLGGGPPFSAQSVFGAGILTWRIPYLFRTASGYNLLVRGPANMPKYGVQPLEGTIETDWVESTFIMNWQMMLPNHTVTFDIGEPVAMLVPQMRGELEIFRPEIRAFDAAPAKQASYLRHAAARFRQGAAPTNLFGVCYDSAGPFDGETQLHLAPFTERR